MLNCKTDPQSSRADSLEKNPALRKLSIKRVVGTTANNDVDLLSVEEPLEIGIRLEGEPASRSIAVTMRTPGEDEDLALGFLYTEGIISDVGQVKGVKRFGCNTLEVLLDGALEIDSALLERHSFIASSCGVCGKKSIEAVQARRQYSCTRPFPPVPAELIHRLPEILRQGQKSFNSSGGLHASGLFDVAGRLIMIREDVGRHNALDKLVGACSRAGLLPLDNNILVVSGRASFELVQKAAHAGITTMVAVGAPSSLAVDLAQNSGLSLIGFVRENRFNLYTGMAVNSLT